MIAKVWIEFGRIKLPQGYHPNDTEKEWGKLIIAMLERDKTLRPEVERYASECLAGLGNTFSVGLICIENCRCHLPW